MPPPLYFTHWIVAHLVIMEAHSLLPRFSAANDKQSIDQMSDLWNAAFNCCPFMFIFPLNEKHFTTKDEAKQTSLFTLMNSTWDKKVFTILFSLEKKMSSNLSMHFYSCMLILRRFDATLLPARLKRFKCSWFEFQHQAVCCSLI